MYAKNLNMEDGDKAPSFSHSPSDSPGTQDGKLHGFKIKRRWGKLISREKFIGSKT
jgi:hypothetical protein